MEEFLSKAGKYLTEMPEEGYRKHIDDNDCVVRALANATGVSYLEAFAMCQDYGRKPGKGMYPVQWLPLLQGELKDRYMRMVPTDAHRWCRTAITAHRWMSRWQGTYVVLFKRHVAVWRDGEWLDWMDKSRRYQTQKIWKVEEDL